MNLPFILDIALGLIFIYLILSLLASEIQELIGTVLQWRAEHLKLSIEVLLSGNDRKGEAAAQELADSLYDSPLIRSLNQEAKGRIGRTFRGICHFFGRAYRLVTRTRNVFGPQQTSGPSYIPAEAFTTSLMERMELDKLWQVLVEDRIRQYVQTQILLPVNHSLNDLKASSGNEFLLSGELRQLEQAVDQILQDFRAGHVRLPETIDRLIARLDEFAVVAQEVLPDHHHLTETFLRRLDYIRRRVASSEVERKALLEKLRPSIAALVDVFDQGSVTYQELVNLAQRSNPQAAQLLETIKHSKITPALKNSLATISKRVEATVNTADEMAGAFGTEVERWFERGMDRAGGVYKRNAKAVALIIGVVVATAINADSLHIANRLATDPAVRSTITQTAEQFANNPNYTNSTGNLQGDLESVQTAVNETLETLPLPLGYTQTVIEQQRQAEAEWPLPIIQRRFIGWLISGVAIAMGASFWFDLLKKVVNVRSSGDKSS